ncbi:DUF2516 family protein [Zafaria sp. Z1313]|uniref:DUF2516 family protein n=1 Tax=unclassified Zafaria TaxID=2828765 RepID=UPI002E774406|nr:DUF2516 family protein [Zafaria sp. J156]MEE1622034.1 DUF2516 family protein [Zafaria sp. J156]
MAYTFEMYLFQALSLVVLGLALWAFLDNLRHPAANFQREDKRTKGFWMALNGVSTGVALLSVAGGGGGGILMLVAACIVCVYLADVRPAVSGKGTGYYNY